MSVLQASRPSGAYGRELAEKFGVDDAPAVVTRLARRSEVAVTELRLDEPSGDLSDPFTREDAYLVSLLLRDLPDHQYWEDGRRIAIASLRAGDCMIHDLKRGPAVLIDKPLHSLLFYLPRGALDALADDANVPRITELDYEPGAGIVDGTVKNIGLSLLTAVRTPERVSRIFTDHATLAVAGHIAQTYGGLQTLARPAQGGLAPWQEKRARDLLAADLSGSTPLEGIARACGLSASHFCRAFRKSTGLAPHAWLQNHRIETAKAMLRRREAPLSSVALACGFADQSHFTRVFSRQVGISPGAWRRCLSE